METLRPDGSIYMGSSLKGTSIKTRMETVNNYEKAQKLFKSLKGTSIKTRMET